MLSAVPQSLQMNARSPGAPSFGAMSATSCIVRPHRLQGGFDSSITLRPDARSYPASMAGLRPDILATIGG
jgi:hypothetical protein